MALSYNFLNEKAMHEFNYINDELVKWGKPFIKKLSQVSYHMAKDGFEVIIELNDNPFYNALGQPYLPGFISNEILYSHNHWKSDKIFIRGILDYMITQFKDTEYSFAQFLAKPDSFNYLPTLKPWTVAEQDNIEPTTTYDVRKAFMHKFYTNYIKYNMQCHSLHDLPAGTPYSLVRNTIIINNLRMHNIINSNEAHQLKLQLNHHDNLKEGPFTVTGTKTMSMSSSSAGDFVPQAILNAIPELRNNTKCPVCGSYDSIFMTVQHLNDGHKWSRAAIADWTETLDVKLEFKKPSEQKKTPEKIPISVALKKESEKQKIQGSTPDKVIVDEEIDFKFIAEAEADKINSYIGYWKTQQSIIKQFNNKEALYKNLYGIKES